MSTLVPLALLSAAMTASLVGVGTPTSVSAVGDPTSPATALPDGTSVPTRSIEAPASISTPDAVAPAFQGSQGQIDQIVATTSTNGIPSAALSAYQRAETVINAADKSCHLRWQLIAAIGRVESNHGRFGGSALNDKGIAVPAILGPVLNGRAGTSAIRDTDAGTLDSDKRFDRAVGPMQFIPSTWSVVGVDADNDGERNPQDINDAALATAVYLCSGNDDLANLPGQKAAVYRYNHSQSYVNLVLKIMNNYLEGDFTSVPNSTTAAGYLVPAPVKVNQDKGKKKDKASVNKPADITTPESTTPAETPPPADNSATSGTSGDTNKDTKKGKSPLNLPIPSLPPVTVPAVPQTSVKPVDDVLTLAQAIVQCTLDGLIDNPLSPTDKFDACVKDYTTKG